MAPRLKKPSITLRWRAKGGDATHATFGMIAGVCLAGVLFLAYLYHYNIRPSAGSTTDKPVVVVQTTSRVEPNTLPRDVSSLGIPPSGISVPINQPTRGETVDYQQVGILTSDRKDGMDEPIIVPIFGRPTYRGSQKYQYYGASDKVHMSRIPVVYKGKDCTEEYGCDEIYEGDRVTVPAYNREFVANIYKKDNLRYIPY
jgi:Family of unknown function (DUF5755)